MNPLEADSECELVSTSSTRLISGNYKSYILAYDMLCVKKLKRNMYMRSRVIVLSIYKVVQQTYRNF